MKNTFPILLFAFCLSCSDGQITFETDSLSLSLNSSGQVTSLTDRKSGINYLSKDSVSHFLQIRKEGKFIAPSKASINDGVFNLIFTDQTSIDVRLEENSSHLTFELISISDSTVDLVQWGPYQTTINSIIG